MKKLLMLALAVLGVTAAQAVNVTWTLSLGGPQPESQSDAPGYAPGWCGLVMTTETITDKDSFKDLFTDSTLSGESYTLANANTTAIKVSGDKTYANLGQTWGAVTHEFTTENVTSNTVTFALFNIWNVNKSDGGYATLTVTDIDTTAESLTIDLTDTTLAWAQKTVNSATVSSVPEPTVLALLALGVAGMALKRKVA